MCICKSGICNIAAIYGFVACLVFLFSMKDKRPVVHCSFFYKQQE